MEVLRSASTPPEVSGMDSAVTVIFKGGTSLSRAHGIIERFSEDIDLLVCFSDGVSRGARERVLKAVGERARLHLGLDESAVTAEGQKPGIRRNFRFAYPRQHPPVGETETVLLEMGTRGGPTPAGTHAIRSLLADYAVDQLGDPVDEWDEFAPFEVLVLGAERTLLEKLSRLHTGAVLFERNGDDTILSSCGRHLYDVHEILRHEPTRTRLQELGSDGVLKMCDDIDIRSAAANLPYEPRPPGGFGDSPLFDGSHDCQRLAEAALTQAQTLVHGEFPTFAQCVAQARTHSVLL